MLLSVVAAGVRRLEAAGIATGDAERDATVLARAVLGWDSTRWVTDRHRAASPEFETGFTAALERRAAREPLAYILGEREFYGRPFHVSSAVLVPRPETELVVDRALAVLAEREQPAPTILDVGTGSGCLGITLALECPASQVVATDISRTALDVARRNAERHAVGNRIALRREALTAGLEGAADLVVSNPPYVAETDRASLPDEVRVHEPAVALFGGPDGLDVIRKLAPAAARALKPGRWLVMEIGAGQQEAVDAIVQRAGFRDVRIAEDLAGIPRVVVARRL